MPVYDGTDTPVTPAGLTASGQQRTLADCEAVIERGMQTFIEVGEALLEIRDRRLYLEGHPTFEDYCQQRWGFKRAHAYRLMEASTVAGLMSPMGDTPGSERAARELAVLKDDPDQMHRAWVRAQRMAGNDQPTAAVVRRAVDAEMNPNVFYVPPVSEEAVREASRLVQRMDAAAEEMRTVLIPRLEKGLADGEVSEKFSTAEIKEILRQGYRMLREYERMHRYEPEVPR